MSDVVGIEKITDRAGTGAPDFTNGFNIAGSDSGIGSHKHTEGATEPSSPSNGDAWLDTDNNVYKVYIDGEWKDWLGTSTSPPTFNWGGSRAVYMGRFNYPSPYDREIDYFNISSSSNAADFGDLTQAREDGAGVSNGTRAVFAGGKVGGTKYNTIDYITTATTGNAQDFGDLTTYPFSTTSASSRDSLASAGNATYGLFMGGYLHGGGNGNIIDYITIANTGNATDFGDLTAADHGGSAFNDATRAVYVQGTDASKNNIEYVSIATPGNATNFGTQTTAHSYEHASCADATRGLTSGGISSAPFLNHITYFTTQSAGNGTDFGNLTARCRHGSASDGTYGTFIGGYATSSSPYLINVIERVTIQTPANATDHGDMQSISQYIDATSGSAS